MTTVGAYEAKTHLPELLKRVESGEHITIARHGTPVAVLIPVGRLPPARPRGGGGGAQGVRQRASPRRLRHPRGHRRRPQVLTCSCWTARSTMAWVFDDEDDPYAACRARPARRRRGLVPGDLAARGGERPGRRRAPRAGEQSRGVCASWRSSSSCRSTWTPRRALSPSTGPCQIAHETGLSVYDAAYLELPATPRAAAGHAGRRPGAAAAQGRRDDPLVTSHRCRARPMTAAADRR